MFPSSQSDTVMDAAFEADAFEALVLDVPSAHIQLQSHSEADRVQVHGGIPGADPDAARTLFDRKGISTHQSGNRLHIFGERLSEKDTDWRWRTGHPTAVHLDVHLPPDLDVTAQAAGGTIQVSDLAGTVELAVPGGSVHASQIKGPLRVHGNGGELTVEGTTDAALTLEWGAGPVTLERLRKTSVALQVRSASTTVQTLDGSADLSVHGGSLTIQDVTGPCDAKVHGGPLTYRGAPDQDTSLRAVGGPLHTHLPPDHPVLLTLAGSQVSLDHDFVFEGERTPHRIDGRLNGGGISFEGRAIQGSVQCCAMPAG